MKDAATRVPPREDLALDGAAVAFMLGAPSGAGCSLKLLQRKPKRVVVRYDIEGLAPVVGKWYSTDRGALVWEALHRLRTDGFDAVPAPVAYHAGHRALFVEAIDGPTLRELITVEPAGAARAGVWLARFHRSGFDSPRDCGPSKMIGSVRRWSERAPGLARHAPALSGLLEACPSPGLPVHYDYYHAQVLCPPGRDAVVVDLDESGLGDPGFDVAHFIAHLRRLGVRQQGSPAAYADAETAFLDGYRGVGPLPEVRPAHEAFAWFKLASQAVARGQPELAGYAEASLRALTSKLR